MTGPGPSFGWRVQAFLAHPVRLGILVALLVGIPTAMLLIDELRVGVLGSAEGRIAVLLLLLAAGGTVGVIAGQLLQALRRQAFTDSLTGLYNRRFMDVQLGLLDSRAGRYGRHYAVLVFDIDGLKQVNDTYGHDVGDLALRRFATILSDALRRSDVAIRTGGDEFVAILPETPCHDAHVIFDRVRARVLALRDTDPRLEISVSAGAVGWRSGRSLEKLVHDADSLLLTAKREGKDRLETELAPA